MRTKIILVILILLVIITIVLLIGLSDNLTNHQGYTNITVEQAYTLLTNSSNGIQIPIDVSSNSEWAVAHIDTPSPEHPQHWPYLQNGVNLTAFLELYQGKEIILYCKAGVRSNTAANLLVEHHFNGTIYNMLGGVDAWVRAGYPTKASDN